MGEELRFDCASYSADGELLSYLDSGGDKEVVHFSHANGFPISMYLPLLNELAPDFRVIGLNLRGQDGQTEGILSWHRLSFDLIGFLDGLGCGPVVGVGHSIGAVTAMLSAARRPDLFSRLVLIDPVLLPWKYTTLIRLMNLLGKKARFPLARRARRRRNGWQSREEALAYFRGKDLFDGWEEAFLRAYVTYGLRPESDGRIVLVCPPEAEACAFENYPVDIWSWPALLRTPVVIIRGETSDTLTQECFRKFCRLCPSAKGIVMKGVGHFAPMQNSAETIRLIRGFCEA